MKINSKIEPIGNSNHFLLDNVWTLVNSNSDAYGGTVDYLFFKILNCLPVEYFNLTPLNFQEEFTEKEINQCEKDYFNFERKNKFSKKILEDIEKITKFARKNALEDGCIKESIIKGKYIEKTTKYNASYVMRQIIKFYKRQLVTEE